ncbi:MAG: nucleotidyltransferase domain-containing protein [Gemmatimonadales bacterium]|nr:nucleotidyltransferase domain-containing protein [Gemmatimonadales bacterium]
MTGVAPARAIDPRIEAAFLRDNGFPLREHLIVLGVVGSHSHGTYFPPDEPDAVDDVDLMGFVVPPLDYHLGLPRWEHWTYKEDELDVVIYSLNKAVRLLLKSNPNIVGMLWLREEDYIHQHPVFSQILTQRGIFSSRHAAAAFAGYAYGQLQRMEAFDPQRMAEYESLTSAIAAVGDTGEVLVADGATLLARAQQWALAPDLLLRFRALHRSHFSGYMGAKRKAMVRKYQYDVKNAAHLIRLLRMGAEFLRTGVLQVYRTTDGEEIKAIKRGEWALDRVKAEAKTLFEGLEAARETSPLPTEPDREGAHLLLLSTHRTVLALGRPIPSLARGVHNA